MNESNPAQPSFRTLAELRASGWRSRTVKEELRANLLVRLAEGESVLPSVVGYDDSRLARLSHVDLTTIAQDTEQISTLAVTRAIARIEETPEGGLHVGAPMSDHLLDERADVRERCLRLLGCEVAHECNPMRRWSPA